MRLNYINQADLAVSFTYEGYQIGGLSGIDYDSKTDTYIAESDNGANGKPPAIFKFQFTGLTNSDGTPKINMVGKPIPLNGISNVESLRFDPKGNGFWVTTEESKPSIYHYDKNGKLLAKLKVPTYIENNARPDLNFKGSTFAPDGSYFVSMERNLSNDPPGYSRILNYDQNGNLIAEYAYYTDRPSTVGATSNGISEILALDNTHLLVLERGFNANINENANPDQSVNPVRIYEIDLTNAKNVIGQDPLPSPPPTVNKTLIFDSRNPSIAGKLNTQTNKIDNIEGMTLGPKLPNGHQSVILVSDDNYNPLQGKTQFISLEMGTSLNYINQLDIPVNTVINGQVIGGISGIDYDPKTDTYLIETDHDDSGHSIVYKVKINGLLDPNTKPTITIQQPLRLAISDAESIRYDPNGNGFWVTTEETTAGIYHYDFKGNILNHFHLPDWMNGRIQNNLGLEGSTFSPNGSYFVSLERNLTNDPPGYSRIIQFNPDGSIAHEYVYYTDKPSTIGATSNGISEILALDDTHLLVLERGHKTGTLGNQVRIYEIDLTNAQDVKNIQTLSSTTTPPINKILVFDSNDPSIANKLNDSTTKIDNIEGMTLGPKLPNGHQSIILVSDNNFNPDQLKTQFISLDLDNSNICFLKGTKIPTKRGILNVENIIPGDLVYTYQQNGWSLQPVIWTGKQNAKVITNQPDDLAGYPVCIRANTLDDGIPSTDLYITPEHCLFLENIFIPVRMLVNGQSIFYDYTYKNYDFYHIETEQHAIIAANNVLTETYLDTGNRNNFEGIFLQNHHQLLSCKNWQDHAAAPLVTDKHNVKILFEKFKKRANQLYNTKVPTVKKKTQSPDLHLLTDTQQVITPFKVSASNILFHLPPNTNYIRLVSRTSRPCDTLGPFIDDRRNLGLLIGDIILTNKNKRNKKISSHLTAENLSGWMPIESSTCRWTMGNALLPLEMENILMETILSIEIVKAGPYLLAE